MTASTETLHTVRSLSQEGYKYGFVTDIEADEAPPGLNEETVRFISAKKEEPAWLLEWRLAAFRAWQKMIPSFANSSLKVVATEMLSNTASTATPASASRSRSGMPSFS